MVWPDDLYSSLNSYDWLPLSTEQPWDVVYNIRHLIDSVVGTDSTYLDPSVSIHKSAVITNSYIGKGVQVYEGCTIRESIICDGTTIGHGSEVARSIILKQCFVPRFNYVGGSLLGERVQLGGMVALATRRLDNKPVAINWGKQRIVTGYQKVGSFIGDDVTIAFGAHLNPGTVVGRESVVMPQVDLRGYVPPRSLVYVKQQTIVTR